MTNSKTTEDKLNDLINSGISAEQYADDANDPTEEEINDAYEFFLAKN